MAQKTFVLIPFCLILGLASIPNAWAQPSPGNWKIAFLMIDFPDKPGQSTQSYFNTLLFGNHPSNAPLGSMKDFYNEVSYGQLTVSGQVNNGTVNWYRMPHSYSSYINGSYSLLSDAILTATSAGFDFGPYDQDNDGYVDAIILIHAGTGQENTGCSCDIWSHMGIDTSINTSGIDSLGQSVYTGRFAVVPEWWGSVGYMTIGVIAHEFGHILGVPDLYDPDYTSSGLGNWSLMAGGSWNGNLGNRPAHMDAWSKIALGWVNPVVPRNAAELNLPPVETNPVIYKLHTPSQEYFLLENRQMIGFDAALPGPGLLIYHVDDLISSGNRLESYPGCTICTSHYQVGLIQADNRWDLEHGLGRGDAGDPYPGTSNNLQFNDSSSPNSRSYLNQNSGIALNNITRSGLNILAALSDLSAPFTSDFPISQAPHQQTNPHVQFDGTNYMVVWDDFRSGANQVYAARVDSSGLVLDAAGIHIADGKLMDMSFDGTNYLVLWGTPRLGGWNDLFVTRLSVSGTVLDPVGTSLGVGNLAQVAFDGTNYFAVWLGGYFQIYGARITPLGNILDPGGFLLTPGTDWKDVPAIAFGGGNYFLIWRDSQPGTGIASTYGSRMTSDGALLDNPPILVSNGCCFNTAVIYQGNGFLLLWGGLGVRVDKQGNVLDPVPLVLPNNGTSTSVAFDGLNTLVTWQDASGKVLGNYVSPNGTILNASPEVIAIPYARTDSAAVGPGNNGILVVWPDWRNEPAANPNLIWSTCELDSAFYIPALCNVDLYANFAPTIYSVLSVNKTGAGTGSIQSNPAGIQCGTICSASYLNGTSVSLTAVPDAGFYLSGWNGGCSGTSLNCTITVTAPTSVSASFDPITFNLSLTKAGGGSGSVSSYPQGINCGSVCSATFVNGTVAVLTASALSGSVFTGWNGVCSGTTTTCTLTLNADVLVTANFVNVTAAPDLISTLLTVTTTGSNIVITDRIRNQGNGAAGPFTASFYLSVDPVFQNGSDIFVCSRNIVSLAAGLYDPPSTNAKTTCPVPAGVLPGTYYLIEVVDSGFQIAESNEFNNTRYTTTSLYVGPDLIPYLLTGTISGSNLIITDRVRNQGNVDTGPFRISYYVSGDTIYQSGTDIFVCSRSLSSLPAGTYDPPSTNATTTCPIPAGISAGPYYLVSVTDSESMVPESNESNNVRTTTNLLNIGPDLFPVYFTATKSGTNFIIRDRVKNQGNVNSMTFTISFYLSADTVYQPGNDTLICSRTVASLAVAMFDPQSATYTTTTCPIPAGVSPGSYYVISVDDSGNRVLENNETNNSRATTGVITIP